MSSMTVEMLKAGLMLHDGGVLKFGSHRPGGREFCALEFSSIMRGTKFSDSPGDMPDLRPLNDAFGIGMKADVLRTKHLLPVMAALWGWRQWPKQRQRDWAKQVSIETVRQIISQLPYIKGHAIEKQCQRVNTLDTAWAAAGSAARFAAADAAYADAKSAAWAAAEATAYAADAARVATGAAAWTAWAAEEVAWAAAKAAAKSAAWVAARSAAADAAYAARAAEEVAWAAARAAAKSAAYAAEAADAYAGRTSVCIIACAIWLQAVEDRP